MKNGFRYNLTKGQVVNNYTILQDRKLRDTDLLCQCSCGKKKYVSIRRLISLPSTHCIDCRPKLEQKPRKPYVSRCGGETKSDNGKPTDLYKAFALMKRKLDFVEELRDYQEFKKLAFATGYEKGLRVRKLDQNKPVSATNIMWANRWL